jgi:adenine phosphoribosyltransferase
MVEKRLKATIRDVKDFPRKGILFKDITPVMLDPGLCKEIVVEFAKKVSSWNIDVVVGIESRGFLFGMLIAQKLNVPFVPIRKCGKLPHKTVTYKYNLEYGSATIEIHTDAIKSGSRVLIHDDLLATGGTAAAAAELIKMLKGSVAGYAFLVNLDFLKGREMIESYSKKIVSLANY